ncbi:GNAT family N-acetyltransferase [Amycolatopsis sacchari]|uniref:GNAT family N-acetyltransferase n=1 Tax=Amycolatopsis sacchari TaxID=115433 RepID=UPI000B820480|nr:GNAT family N-acetyltransferase [Amycolatopsis sacchari]
MYSIVVADSAIVKSASAADLPAVAEIYAHYVEHSVATFELEPPDLAEWERRFAAVTGAGLPFLVGELDGAVAGYAYCSPWKPRPAYRQTVEDSIYLAPDAVGKGLGGLLLDELLSRCGAAGIREVIAVIAAPGPGNVSSSLHRRRGFTDAGRLTAVGYKHGQWLDTQLMQRSLVPR